ncbi:hypothetical protein QE152_g40776 [Popillia japonica]|uniref:Endonuclease/exonuclease/phosphatase domain-containing protein n=1 Tax=Popillia japonica TaxID=7064 RepID=A0AAW1HFF9_POPJA
MRCSRGGGVDGFGAIKNDHQSQALDFSSITDSFSTIDVDCKVNFCNSVIHVVVIYIPPNTSALELNDFFDRMCAYEFITGADLIICGDFNIPTFSNSVALDARSGAVNDFMSFADFNIPTFSNSVALDARSGAVNDFMSFANVTQKNTFKNANNRLLDLILSNVECQLFREDDPLVGVDEHHPPLLIDVVLNTA